MSDHGLENINLGHPKIYGPIWKQFDEILIVMKQRKL